MLNHDTDVCRRDFFNQRAEQWLDMWYKNETTGDYSRHDKQFERLFSLAPLHPGERVLDLGCGSGVLVPYLLRHLGPDGNVHEVDYAERMIEVNRRLHNDPRVTFSACSADQFRTPHPDFDVAFCFSCFPHFHRKEESLTAIAKALKPNGRLVIAHFDSSHGINHHHRKHECVKHDFLPDESTMRRLLVNAGFEVLRLTDEPGFYFVAAARPAS